LKVVLVSRNAGKLRELRALLPRWRIEPLDTTGIDEENGATFYENARAKACFGRGRAAADAWSLGEDSGLEVKGLNGAPGLVSARFAGPEATDPENVERLLGALRGIEGTGRRARYVCELVLISPSGLELRGSGVLAGAIAPAPRGSGGFGYDPVFLPEGQTRTVAELGDVWKAQQSHRARAARLLDAAVESRPRRPDELC
jgi:XTP/dITP diphosphohydrolase